jgi:hypothetical protein
MTRFGCKPVVYAEQDGVWDTEGEVAPLVTWTTIPEDQHAWFMLEDLADFVRAQMPHFCDLDDRVVALCRCDIFLLGYNSHGSFLTF